ncbi:hypothetical protein N9005_05520 [Akkermansiaceae bacterium]|nr:hypothetical protein [Akkermansiaceae bacterium]
MKDEPKDDEEGHPNGQSSGTRNRRHMNPTRIRLVHQPETRPHRDEDPREGKGNKKRRYYESKGVSGGKIIHFSLQSIPQQNLMSI